MTITNSRKINGYYPVEYYYLIKKDMVQFRIELNNFCGFVCRKYFPGIQQVSLRYQDARDEIFIWVWDWLEHPELHKAHYDPIKGKFTSYLYMLLRWRIGNYVRKWNKERKNEMDIDLNNRVKITYSNTDITLQMVGEYTKELINKWKLTSNTKDILSSIMYNDEDVINKHNTVLLYESKFLAWKLAEKFLM